MSGNGFVERVVNHRRLSRDLPIKLRPKGGREEEGSLAALCRLGVGSRSSRKALR